MITKLKIIAVVLFALIFSSCEKDLKVNLPTGNSYLVVEGEIESDNYPFVVLTNSIGFFDKIDLGSLKFEKNAEITVTDLNTNYSAKLIAISIPIPNTTDSLTFYTVPPIPAFDSIKGVFGHFYKLNIINKGKVHEAITKIPYQNIADSIWVEKANTDSTFFTKVLYKNPDTLGNYARLKTRVQRADKSKGFSEEFLTGFGSTIDDKFTNGQRLPFLINLGFDKNVNFQDSNSRARFEAQTRVYKGDTVTVKISAIDYSVYNFWQTLEYSRNSTGNPFASPTKVQSNVSNAIGIWGGYGSKTITVAAPK
jgi:Domain of unknown function (DUF4249)